MQHSPMVSIYQHDRTMPEHMLEGCYKHSDNIRVGIMWGQDRYVVRVDIFQNEKDLDQ
jgi:hypothetical protein